jgi:glyoxylase-like metal-dependent hydrolase (beta-lactamase superfamily II)
MSSIWTKQLGAVRIAVIREASGWWPIERALIEVPEAVWRPEIPVNAQNQLRVDFNLGHIALPGASIVVDTGFGEYDPTDPANPLVTVHGMTLDDKLDVSLAKLGVRAADVTHVLITHMHGDHILGATRVVAGRRVPAFPNARYLIMEDEWASAPAFHQNALAINAQKEALVAADALDLVQGQREVAPGVSFLPAPGESPGHAIVRVQSESDVAYYLGDLFHYPAEFRHLDWTPLYRDRASLEGSRRRLLPRAVAEDAWLIPAHHPFPAIGKVEPDGGAYRWIELDRR